MVSRHEERAMNRKKFLIGLPLIAYAFLKGKMAKAQNTYRRYIAPKEYNQRIMQEHLDDIAKRLNTLERGR